MTSPDIIDAELTDQWGEATIETLALKLAEETGEVAAAVNKIPEGRATIQNLRDELGDVLIVASRIAAQLHTTLETLLDSRFKTIQARTVQPSMQSAGGTARAASMTRERRSEIATKAANNRWSKTKPTDP